MKTLCIIPARLGSTRLPRKPLQLLADKPIVQHTFEKAMACKAIDKVVVATDSEEVAAPIQAIKGKVVMTSSDIRTGSDRVAYAARKFPEYDIVINLQGDEPFIKPDMLATLVQSFVGDDTVQMATLAFALEDQDTYQNPDNVKVIMDKNADAIYFSRSPIPYYRSEKNFNGVLHHMGVYAFRKDFLQTYTSLEQTPFEQAELLEQLRALEHGYKIRVCPVKGDTLEINTPEELALARERILGQ